MIQKLTDNIQQNAYAGLISRSSQDCQFMMAYANTGDILPGTFVFCEPGQSVSIAKKLTGNVTNKLIPGVCVVSFIHVPSLYKAMTPYAKGYLFPVLTKGSVYVKTTAAVNVGKYILIKSADSSIVYDDNMTKNDHICTGFQVIQGGGANSIIEIRK